MSGFYGGGRVGGTCPLGWGRVCAACLQLRWGGLLHFLFPWAAAPLQSWLHLEGVDPGTALPCLGPGVGGWCYSSTCLFMAVYSPPTPGLTPSFLLPPSNPEANTTSSNRTDGPAASSGLTVGEKGYGGGIRVGGDRAGDWVQGVGVGSGSYLR